MEAEENRCFGSNRVVEFPASVTKMQKEAKQVAEIGTRKVIRLTNCRIIIDHELVKKDLWWEITPGSKNRPACSRIIDAKKAFWDASEAKIFAADYVFDCHNLIAAPGSPLFLFLFFWVSAAMANCAML